MKPKTVQIGDYRIPPMIAGGLARYVLANIETGSALRAILSGDLFEAFARMDSATEQSLGHIVRVISNYTPSVCYGDAGKVRRWLKARSGVGLGVGFSEAHKSKRIRGIWEGWINA
jgi:hypothetical protein